MFQRGYYWKHAHISIHAWETRTFPQGSSKEHIHALLFFGVYLATLLSPFEIWVFVSTLGNFRNSWSQPDNSVSEFYRTIAIVENKKHWVPSMLAFGTQACAETAECFVILNLRVRIAFSHVFFIWEIISHAVTFVFNWRTLKKEKCNIGTRRITTLIFLVL